MLGTLDYIIYDKNSMRLYSYCSSSDKEEALRRAKQYNKEEIQRVEKLLMDTEKRERYNDREYFEEQLRKYKNVELIVATEDDYYKNYTEQPIKEITEEFFNEKLEELPPAKWCTIQGVEMFCMIEMLCGNVTQQFGRVGDKYYTKYVDIRNKDTWLHNHLRGIHGKS